MNKIAITMFAMAFLLLPLNSYGQSEQTSTGAPPISQALIPEGDFAVKLAIALKLGTPENEAQAEDILTSVGITSRNGWIADYPITPDIIGELENSVATAVEAMKGLFGNFPVDLAASAEAEVLQVAVSLVAAEAGAARAAAKLSLEQTQEKRGSFDPLFYISRNSGNPLPLRDSIYASFPKQNWIWSAPCGLYF